MRVSLEIQTFHAQLPTFIILKTLLAIYNIYNNRSWQSILFILPIILFDYFQKVSLLIFQFGVPIILL